MKLFYGATCRLAGGLLVLAMLGACAGTPQSDRLLQNLPQEFARPVELSDTPFYPQEKYQCGPAALATILRQQGVITGPEQLREQVYIPARQGSLQIEMIAATRRHGLIPYVLQPDLEEVLHEVRNGRPVLVLQNLGLNWYPAWHYAVVIGYNLQDEVLVLRSGTTERYVSSIHTFERTWQRGQRWAMIALLPGQLPALPDEWRYLKAIVGFEQLRNWTALNAAYAAGLAHWPQSRDLNMGVGNASYIQGELARARSSYQAVLALYPDYAPAHNNLAQVLAEQGEYTSALTHARRAIALGGVHGEQYQATLREIEAMLPGKK